MYNYSFNLVVVYISFNWSIIDRFLFGSQHWLNIHAHIHLNDWLSSSSSSVVVVVSRLTSTCQLCRYDSTFGQVWWYTRLSNERLLFRSSHWKKNTLNRHKGKDKSLSLATSLSLSLFALYKTDRTTDLFNTTGSGLLLLCSKWSP